MGSKDCGVRYYVSVTFSHTILTLSRASLVSFIGHVMIWRNDSIKSHTLSNEEPSFLDYLLSLSYFCCTVFALIPRFAPDFLKRTYNNNNNNDNNYNNNNNDSDTQ